MPTLSFWDQLEIGFWSIDQHIATVHTVRKQMPKKNESKNNQIITLTHYSHLQIWLVAWHLQQWHSVLYLIFDIEIVQI